MRHVPIPILVMICFFALATMAIGGTAHADQSINGDTIAEVAPDIASAQPAAPAELNPFDAVYSPAVGSMVSLCFEGQPAVATAEHVACLTTAPNTAEDITQTVGRILLWRNVSTSRGPLHRWIAA